MEVHFTFLDRDIQPVKVQCKVEEKFVMIFERLAKKIQINSNNFEFYYKDNLINRDSTIMELKQNYKIISDFGVSVMSKSPIMKCPDCICNNCIIRIEDYKLKFSDCCHYGDKHQSVKNIDDYEDSQRINYKQIKCHECGMTLSKSLQDFYKCFDCSKLVGSAYYFCNKCYDETRKHATIKYNEKYYFCRDHFHKHISYCKKCKSNLCDECEKEHDKNHSIKRFDTINLDTKFIKKELETIKSETEKLKIIVYRIKNMLDGAVNIMEKYYSIAHDLIGKYETYNKSLKNYQVLESISYLNNSNKEIMGDLRKIIQGNKSNEDWINKCIQLIGIYLGDRYFYENKKPKTDINQEEKKEEGDETEANFDNFENKKENESFIKKKENYETDNYIGNSFPKKKKKIKNKYK